MRSPSPTAWRQANVDAVRANAGVADQDNTCPHGTPDCPECGSGVGTRCSDATNSAGVSAPLPPHEPRRERARELVDDFDHCPEAPIPAVDDSQTRLVPDGGEEIDIARPEDLSRVQITDDIESVTISIIADDRERTIDADAIAQVVETYTPDGEYATTEVVVKHGDTEREKDLLRGLSRATIECADGETVSGSVPWAKTGQSDHALLVISLKQGVATDGGHIQGPHPGPQVPRADRGRDWICGGCDDHFHGRPEYIEGGHWSCYCSLDCYIKDQQFLGFRLHKCDLCGQVFDSLNELGGHSCEPVERTLTDGGITAERYRRQEADSVRQHAGVSHQGRCINGTEGCPGPGGPGLPCTDCFLAGGDR